MDIGRLRQPCVSGREADQCSTRIRQIFNQPTPNYRPVNNISLVRPLRHTSHPKQTALRPEKTTFQGEALAPFSNFSARAATSEKRRDLQRARPVKLRVNCSMDEIRLRLHTQERTMN